MSTEEFAVISRRVSVGGAVCTIAARLRLPKGCTDTITATWEPERPVKLTARECVAMRIARDEIIAALARRAEAKS